MKLDKKIKTNAIYDCFKVQESDEHLGSEVYATNDIENFSELEKCSLGRLVRIRENFKSPFIVICDGVSTSFKFFLAKSDVISNDSKCLEYRKLTKDEFERYYPVGTVVRIRTKGTKNEYIVVINQIVYAEDDIFVTFGDVGVFTPESVFKNLEIYSYCDEKYLPFGIACIK